MLTRVLEPEVMDTAEEAFAYDAMDHSQVNRQFVTDFLALLLPPVSQSPSPNPGARVPSPGPRVPDSRPRIPVLDVGTGTALIPIELCRRHPDVHVVAIDLADHMLALARKNVHAAKLGERITLERVDAKQLPANASFAAVISNSIVHHIPEPRVTLREMIRVAAPGGLIFVRDLLRPSTDETVRQLVATYAGTADQRQRELFDASLRAALSLEEIRSRIQELGYDVDDVQQTSDRHWTWSAVKA